MSSNLPTLNVRKDLENSKYNVKGFVSATRAPFVYSQQLPFQKATIDPFITHPDNKFYNTGSASAVIDYNNTDQVNSLADVFWNTAASTNPIGTLFKTTGELGKNLIYEPLVQKWINGEKADWSTFFTGQLVNMAETFDIIFNPIKGMYFEGFDGLVKGSVGRQNYDYDTGNKFIDVVLECFTDPLNLVATVATFGGWGAAKTAITGAIKTTTGELIEQALKTGSKQALKKVMREAVQTAIKKGSDDVSEILLKSVLKIYIGNVRAFEQAGVKLSTLVDSLVEINKVIVNSRAIQIARGLNTIAKPVRAVDDVLTIFALNTNAITGSATSVWRVLKKTGVPKKVGHIVAALFAKNLENIIRQVNHADIIDYDEMLQTVEMVNKSTVDLMDEAANNPNLITDITQALLRDNAVKDVQELITLIQRNAKEALENIKSNGGNLTTKDLRDVQIKVKETIDEIFKSKFSDKGITSLDDYIVCLEEVNLKAGGAFTDIIESYKHISSDLQRLNTTLKHAQNYTAHTKVTKLTQQLQSFLRAKDVTKFYTFKEGYVDAAYNIIVKLDKALDALSQSASKATQSKIKVIKQNMFNFINTLNKATLEEIIRSVDDLGSPSKNLKNLATNTHTYDFFTQFMESIGEVSKRVEILAKVQVPELTVKAKQTTAKYVKEIQKTIKALDKVSIIEKEGVVITVKPQKTLNYLTELEKLTTDEAATATVKMNDLTTMWKEALTEVKYLKDSLALKDTKQIKKLNTLLTQLKNTSPTKAITEAVTLTSGLVLKRLKADKALSALYLLSDSRLDTVLQSIADIIADLDTATLKTRIDDALSDELRTAMLHEVETLEILQATLKVQTQAINAYRDFMNSVLSAPLPDNIKHSFLSSIQDITIPDDKILSALDMTNFLHRITNAIETQLNTTQVPIESLALDVLCKKYDIVQDFTNKFNSIKSVAELLQKAPELQDILKVHDPKKVYVINFECNSEYYTKGSLRNISIGPMDAPDTGVVLTRKFATREEALAHAPNNAELLRRYNTDSYTIAEEHYLKEVLSQDPGDQFEAVGQQFLNYLSKLPDDAVLVLHNGQRTNVYKFIQDMRLAGFIDSDMAPLMNRTRIDTLAELRTRAGYTTLDNETVYTMHTLVKEQIDRLRKIYEPVEEIRVKSQLFKETSQTLTLAQPPVVEALVNIRKVRRLISKYYSDTTLGSMLSQTAKDLDDILTDASKRDLALKKHLITDLALQQSDAAAALYQLIKSLNNGDEVYAASRVERFLNFRADAPYTVGTKNIVDEELIHSYFKNTAIDGAEVLSLAEAQVRTHLSEQFNVGVKKLINPIPLLERPNARGELVDLLNRIFVAVETAANSKGILNVRAITNAYTLYDSTLRYLDLDKLSPQQLYAIYDWFTSIIERKKITVASLLEEANLRVVEIDSVYSAFKDNDILKTVDKFTAERDDLIMHTHTTHMRNIDDPLAQPDTFEDVVQTFEKATESLDELSKKLDETGMFTTEAAVVSGIMARAQRMIKRMKEYFIENGTESQVNVCANMTTATNYFAVKQTHTILSLPPEQLRNLMVWDAPFIRISKADPYDPVIQNFILNSKAYEEYGIKILNKDYSLEIVLDKNMVEIGGFVDNAAPLKYQLTVNGEVITRPNLPNILQDTSVPYKVIEDADFTREILNEVYEQYGTIGRLSNGLHSGSLGDVVDQNTFRTLYDSLSDEAKEILPSFDVIGANDLFRRPRYNFIELGDMNSRRMVLKYLPDSLAQIIVDSTLYTAKKTSKELKFLEFFQERWYGLEQLNLSDTQIKNILDRNTEFVLMSVRRNKQGYTKVIRYTSDQIDLARKANAMIVPYQMYSTMFETLDTNMLKYSPILDGISKIVHAFKIGWLLDVGVLTRNFVDSLIKSSITTHDLLGTLEDNLINANVLTRQYIQDVSKIIGLDEIDTKALLESGINIRAFMEDYTVGKLTAVELCGKYQIDIENILRMDHMSRFNYHNLDFYFDNMGGNLDKETFMLIHRFMTEGSDTTELGVWKALAKESGEAGTLLDETISTAQATWGGFMKATEFLSQPNAWIERMNRLGMYLTLTKQGLTNSQAFAKIAETHFDYAVKSDLERMIELLIPFYTYTVRNVQFFIKAMADNPTYFKLFFQAMAETWDLDNTPAYELNNNESLINLFMSGNIALNDTTSLKLNPSVFDAMKVMYNPIQTMAGKTHPIIQYALQKHIGNNEAVSDMVADMLNTYRPYNFEEGGRAAVDWRSMVPIIGIMLQRYGPGGFGDTYYEKTDNWLTKAFPGLFGAYNRWNMSNNYTGAKGYTKRMSLKQALYISGAYNKGTKKGNSSKGYKKKSYKKYSKYKYSNSSTSGYPKYLQKYYTKSAYVRKVYAKNTYHQPKLSVYEKYYTKKGKSRLAQMKVATTSQNVKYKIINMQRYLR